MKVLSAEIARIQDGLVDEADNGMEAQKEERHQGKPPTRWTDDL